MKRTGVIWLALWVTLLMACGTQAPKSVAITAVPAPIIPLSTRLPPATPAPTVIGRTVTSIPPTTAQAVPTVIPVLPTSTPTGLPVTEPADAALVARLIGLWHGGKRSFYDLQSAGSFYDLRADGTWRWDTNRRAIMSEPELVGEWDVADSVLHLRDTGGVLPCDPDQIGSYRVSFQEQELVLTLLQDECLERAEQTEGRFSLLKP